MTAASRPLRGIVVATLLFISACQVAPDTPAGEASLHDDVTATIAAFRRTDPSLERFFTTSVGYAVFPSVGKAGFIGGGAYGKGEVFEAGKQVTGYCDIVQGTIGLQVGGQAYREIIFFRDKEALDRFKAGQFALSAQASAVAVKAGAAATADYEGGVAVFTMVTGGLMAEASIGGQEFRFRRLRPQTP